MKTLLRFALLLAASSSAFASEAWSTDFAASAQEAKTSDKPLLALFTGKAWCPPCKMLEKETLSKPAFLTFAEANLKLVELDFPASTEPTKEYQALAKKYGVEGFPTVVVFDANGKELARHVGYMPGGPEAFISWVKTSTK